MGVVAARQRTTVPVHELISCNGGVKLGELCAAKGFGKGTSARAPERASER